MSDADNQMGGRGGETGRPPGGDPTTGASKEAAEKSDASEDTRVTKESEDSFPASDPPANY
jgi:hypothetical protein